eukprot:CAMPEP_0194177714 /NCGR_PEP_ID=MMETSP0154-20130528/11419_1 /TAXON_ID=1049557 /ORGANISM="Thalassiothrix antarctica, Strain L6-D1" /LENGTH=316 /DNA_ID=CAMNT_0038892373 /DNA_START=31 /DNA_END=978 /DNA_ORIENTATION=-
MMSSGTDGEEDSEGKNELYEIKDPNEMDVLLGRGGAALRHPGNQNFRSLVLSNKCLYITSLKAEKLKISRSIVKSIRKNNGRFLERDTKSGIWYEVGDKRAIEKTSQALREGQPKLRQKIEKLGNEVSHTRGFSESQCPAIPFSNDSRDTLDGTSYPQQLKHQLQQQSLSDSNAMPLNLSHSHILQPNLMLKEKVLQQDHKIHLRFLQKKLRGSIDATNKVEQNRLKNVIPNYLNLTLNSSTVGSKKKISNDSPSFSRNSFLFDTQKTSMAMASKTSFGKMNREKFMETLNAEISELALAGDEANVYCRKLEFIIW